MSLRDQIRHPNLPTVSVSAVLAALLVALGTVLASGNTGAVAHLLDGGAWLANDGAGSVSHVGLGGVDATVHLRAPMGNGLKVISDGGHIYIEDGSGHLVRLDPSQLSVVQQVNLSASGVQIVAGGGALYAVDPNKGTITQLNPITLAPIAAPVNLGSKLGPAVVDGSGMLWVPILGQGMVAAVSHGQVRKKVQVANPGSPVSLSIVGPDVVALDPTSATVRTLAGPDSGSTWTVPLAAGAPMTMPAQIQAGVIVPILNTAAAELATLGIGGGDRFQVNLGTGRDQLGTPAINGTLVYVPDYSTGQLIVVDASSGQLRARITVTGRPGYFQLVVNDGEVFVNDASGNQAWVIDGSGNVQPVTKYAASGPTNDPPKTTVPPAPPIPQTPPSTPHDANDTPPPTVVVPGPGGSTTAGAPTDVVATAGESAATVGWQPPTSGPGVSEYQVTLSPGGVTANVPASQRTYTATHLTDGQLYFFTVVAMTGNKPSAAATSNAVKPGDKASATPTNVHAGTTSKAGSINVSWSESGDPGTTLSGFSVSDSVDGTVKTVGPKTDNVTFDGLAPGTTYTFAVVAQAADGTTSNPGISNSVNLVGPPSAPGDVVASAGGSGKINVTWAPPSSNGSPVTGFNVDVEPGSHGTSVNSGTATGASITGLDNGSTYKVTVSATNAFGTGSSSSSVSVRVSAQVPPTPTGATASLSGTTANVEWNPGPGDGDDTASYKVTNLTNHATQTTSSTSTRFTGLTAGSAYAFSVVAVDGSGNAGGAAQTGSVTPQGAPSAPAIISVSPGSGPGQVTVTFGQPAQLNGSTITGYTASGGGQSASGGGSPLTISGLGNGQTVSVTVVAHSSAGDSPPSAPANAPTAGVPAAVSITAASATYNLSLEDGVGTVAWTNPVDAPDSASTGITVDPGDGTAPINLSAGSTSATWATTDTGTYTVTVWSTNAIGRSAPATRSYTVRAISGGGGGSPCPSQQLNAYSDSMVPNLRPVCP